MPEVPVKRLVTALALVLLALAACTTVSEFAAGHVLFPKEAVRSVFERMEKDLSLPGQSPLGLRPMEGTPEGAASSLGPSPTGGCPSPPAWWPVGVACAQETREATEVSLPSDPEGALLDQLKGMIEVREALLSRNERKTFVDSWKREGIVGEARDGLLTFLSDRSKVDREVLARVANENDDRLILMRAVAKSVVTINGVEPSEQSILSLMDSTRREFALVRRRISPQGTWVQLPDGQWVKK